AINVPVGILLVGGSIFALKETKDTVMSKIDFLGISLLSFSILSIMFAVNNLGQGDLLESFLGWGVLGLLVLGILIFAVMIFVEKRNEQKKVDSILPYQLLRKPTYAV